MKTVTYETNGWIKHSEEDVFENGCDPESSQTFFGDMSFAAETLPKLMEKLKEFVWVDGDENVMVDACDIIGRVDMQRYETENGEKAMPHDIAAWKLGQKRLWLTTFSFHVERVEREPVPLSVSFPLLTEA